MPMVLEFDAYDLPVGEWSRQYGTHVGRFSHRIDINITNWSDVPQAEKDNMWEETKCKFHIVDPKGIRKQNFLRVVDARFRTWKCRLVACFVTRKKSPNEGSPNANLKPWELYEGVITEDHSTKFFKHTESSEFKAKSARAKQSAAANIHRHRLGPKSYRSRKEWINKQKLPTPPSNLSVESSSIVTDSVDTFPLEYGA